MEGRTVPSITMDPMALLNAALLEDLDELALDTIDFLVPDLELPLDGVYYELPFWAIIFCTGARVWASW